MVNQIDKGLFDEGRVFKLTFNPFTDYYARKSENSSVLVGIRRKTMDLNLTPREQEVIRTAEAFTREMIVPNAAGWEQERKMPVDALRAAGREGLLGLLVSEEYGGLELGYTAVARVMEEFASGCMFFAFSAVVHNNQGNSLSTFGSAEQIDRFVPGLI